MQDYRKSNRISSILWMKSPVYCFSFRIKFRPREGVVKFPKYNETSPAVHVESENYSSEHVFKWKEKVFSRWQFHHYSEVNNCVLDYEREYNRKIQSNDFRVSQMFTYLDSEEIIPMPKVEIKNEEKSLIERVRGITNDVTSSTRHLFRSELDLNGHDETWQAMHVVWDNSVYNEDSQLLFKEEFVVLSIYHNPVTNSLLLSPRENDIEYNPYDVYTGAGVLGFQYGVQIVEEEDDNEELVALLKKLNSKLDKRQKDILRFDIPSRGKKIAGVHFEIVGARNFDHDNVYVEYTVKIPDVMKCTGDLHGRTHVSKMFQPGRSRRWNYGHEMDFELEYNDDLDPPPLTIYLEAISVDWWRRHRTEGYAHTKLTLLPGQHEETLSCRRPEELDRREAERRRFFVGECHLIKDLSVLDRPQEYDANFRYITSGEISVRWSTITQAHNPGSLSSGPSSASRLLQGAEDALQQYSRAKATLASATEDLDAIYGSGDR